VRFNERIRIAGKLIEDDYLAALLTEVLDCSEGIEPSFFEVTTAVAFLAFARTPANACIIEVGLGGRLDATNVVDRPLVCGIANLGLDHQHFLGSDIVSIAKEKAGIAKPGVPLVCLSQVPEAQVAIVEEAEKSSAPLLLEGRDWTLDPTLIPSLPGAHQVRNANLAWHMLGVQEALAVPRETFVDAIKKARWPGRFQRIGAATWVDGAHNPAAAAALADTLASESPMHLILGILANKDADSIVAALKPRALSLTFVPVGDHAHHDPRQLASRYVGQAFTSLAEALANVPGPRLIAGSLYLVGEALAASHQQPD